MTASPFHSWNSGGDLFPLSFGLYVSKPQSPNISWAYVSAWADPPGLSWIMTGFFYAKTYHVRRWFISFSSTISIWKQLFCIHYNSSHISLASFVSHNLGLNIVLFPSLQLPRWQFKCENPSKIWQWFSCAILGYIDRRPCMMVHIYEVVHKRNKDMLYIWTYNL